MSFDGGDQLLQLADLMLCKISTDISIDLFVSLHRGK